MPNPTPSLTPKPRKSKTTFYRRIFCDIVRGYSKTSFGKKDVFIKHLTTHDQVDLEDIEEDYFNKARARGVPTEKESIDLLIKDGNWSEDDDLEIERNKLYIEQLSQGKQQLMLKSQIDAQDKLIENEGQKLYKLLESKEELVGRTCEKYAKQRINDHYISRSFHNDSELENRLFTEKEFEEVGYNDLAKLVGLHNEQFSLFSESNIQQMVLEDFFFPYMPFCEDTVQFFGISAASLTHNQLKLILFSRVFKSIFDNTEDIPDSIKKDPKALMDFANTSRKGKEELDKHQEKGGATTVVGATSEDYKYMGVDENKGVSLNDAAKKKGGKLNMEDLMNITGS